METESLEAPSKSIAKRSVWLGCGLNGMVPSTCVLLREWETGELESHSLTLSIHLRSVDCLPCQAIQGAGMECCVSQDEKDKDHAAHPPRPHLPAGVCGGGGGEEKLRPCGGGSS